MSRLQKLTDGVAHKVYEYCDGTSLVRLLKTSKSFRNIRTMDSLWLAAAASFFGNTETHDTKQGDANTARDKNSRLSRPFAGYTLVDHRPCVYMRDYTTATTHAIMPIVPPFVVLANVMVQPIATPTAASLAVTTTAPVKASAPTGYERYRAAASQYSSLSFMKLRERFINVGTTAGSSKEKTSSASVAMTDDDISSDLVEGGAPPTVVSGAPAATGSADDDNDDALLGARFGGLRMMEPAYPSIGDTAYTYKIVSVGDANSGSTCMLRRGVYDTFDDDYRYTSGVADFDYKERGIIHQKTNITIQHWNNPNMRVSDDFWRGAHGVFLSFDLSNYATWANIANGHWMKEIKKHAPPNRASSYMVILVGQKNDLPMDPRYNLQDIYKYVDDHKLPFVTCSAKTGAGVDFAYRLMIASVFASEEFRTNPATAPVPGAFTLHGRKASGSASSSGGSCVVQ